MPGKTISFCKGKGSLNHNNRVFISENVHEERIPWNRTYKKETLEEAYEKCFGEAVREYNAGQKRNDRKIENYLKKIKFSNNKEKLFYENVVQLGDRHDTPVVDTDGNLTVEAKEAIEMLEEYLKTFSERNPNLYIFNCVLHLDESTPHIHFDYIPIAQGYKTGMKKRNSLSKAFQQMGIAKGKGQFENETIYWEAREREYLMGLCRERGIEVVIKGDKRDNLTLPEYKAAMRKVEGLEQEAERLEKENTELQQTASALSGQVQEMQEEKAVLSEQKSELVEQAKELGTQLEKLEAEKKEKEKVIEKQEMKAETLKTISKEVNAEAKKMKSSAVPVNSLFGGEEYVKVKKTDWSRLMDAFSRAVASNKLVEQYEKDIPKLKKRISVLEEQVEKLKRFIASKGLGEAFVEFVKSTASKSIHDRIAEKKEQSKEMQKQKQKESRGLPLKKRMQQEI